MKGSSSFSLDRLNFDHPEVNAVTTLVQKNMKKISSFNCLSLSPSVTSNTASNVEFLLSLFNLNKYY